MEKISLETTTLTVNVSPVKGTVMIRLCIAIKTNFIVMNMIGDQVFFH